MRIISDITNQEYQTVEECLAAEAEFIAEHEKEKLAAAQREEERKRFAEEIETVRAHYHSLIDKYNEVYGPYKRVYKINTNTDISEDIVNIISEYFK